MYLDRFAGKSVAWKPDILLVRQGECKKPGTPVSTIPPFGGVVPKTPFYGSKTSCTTSFGPWKPASSDKMCGFVGKRTQFAFLGKTRADQNTIRSISSSVSWSLVRSGGDYSIQDLMAVGRTIAL